LCPRWDSNRIPTLANTGNSRKHTESEPVRPMYDLIRSQKVWTLSTPSLCHHSGSKADLTGASPCDETSYQNGRGPGLKKVLGRQRFQLPCELELKADAVIGNMAQQALERILFYRKRRTPTPLSGRRRDPARRTAYGRRPTGMSAPDPPAIPVPQRGRPAPPCSPLLLRAAHF
jgi:hypothetical protein